MLVLKELYIRFMGTHQKYFNAIQAFENKNVNISWQQLYLWTRLVFHNFRKIKRCRHLNEQFCITHYLQVSHITFKYHTLPSSVTHYVQVSRYIFPYFPRKPSLIKALRNGMILCNKFVNMPIHEAVLNTFCNSTFYVNTIISYHHCEIN